MTPRGKTRITQVAECCGRPYYRWRFADRPFVDRYYLCIHCERRLIFHPSPKNNKAAALRHYHRRRLANLQSGLTCHGTTKVRQFLGLTNREKQQRRRQRFFAQGLNSRGIARVNNLIPPVETAWRQFRAEIQIPVADFLTPAERNAL